MSKSDRNEDDILTTCALRFNGWEYAGETGFDHRAALDEFFATGRWPESSLEQLTIFFMLQRGLFKWGLERSRKHGRYWRAFRELFLMTHSYAIPEYYQHKEYCEQWASRYQPNLAEHAALIRHIHETTRYDDNATPQL